MKGQELFGVIVRTFGLVCGLNGAALWPRFILLPSKVKMLYNNQDYEEKGKTKANKLADLWSFFRLPSPDFNDIHIRLSK